MALKSGFQKMKDWLSKSKKVKDSVKSFNFTLSDLLGTPPEERGSIYFLGYFSSGLIDKFFEKYGVYKSLKSRGYKDLKLIVDTKDPYRHRVALYSEKQDNQHLLGEAVLRRKPLTIETPFPSKISGQMMEFLAVEWLCLQDPQGRFTKRRPRLPGQDYPGLGIGPIAVKLLLTACSRMHLSGILNIPEYFHNSQMYSRKFLYLNPELEGKRRAIARDLLKKMSIAEASWVINCGCLLENDRPFTWFVAEQIFPINKELRQYFQMKEYQDAVKTAEKQHRYTVNMECWEEKKPKIDRFMDD